MQNANSGAGPIENIAFVERLGERVGDIGGIASRDPVNKRYAKV